MRDATRGKGVRGSSLIAMCVLLAAGCSSFPRDFEAAAAAGSTEEAPLSGAWEGRWLSEASGHTGELRCIISPDEDGGPDRYTARYRARWGGIFRFEYTLPMEAEETGGVHRFGGEADLGWFWGTYTYSGEVAGDRFNATYRTAKDHGSFDMTRVTEAGTSGETAEGGEEVDG